MFAINTRLSPEDWDYIGQQAYNAFRCRLGSAHPTWKDLNDADHQAWIEAGVRAVTVAIGGLPQPEHVIAPLKV